MAGFSINARLILQPPDANNLRQVASSIEQSLGKISGFNFNSAGLKVATAELTKYAAAVDNAATGLALLSVQQTKIKNTGAGFKQVTKDVEETISAVENFGRATALAFRRNLAFVAGTLGLYKLATAFKDSVSEAVKFDREVVRLAQVSNQTVQSLKGITSEVDRLSTTLGVSSGDLIKVAVTLKQAGLSAKDTKIALEALAQTQLSATFGDINESAEGFIALSSQFNIGAADLSKAFGSLNAVAAKFAVESKDLITGIQKAGGVFAQASKGIGAPLDQLNEFISLFTAVRATTRESADSIATGLRTIFGRLQRASTIDLLREYNIELTDMQGNFVGVFEAFSRLSQGLKGLNPRSTEFFSIIEELGGYRQLSKTIPAITQFRTALEAYQVAQRGANSLSKETEVAQQSLEVQITKVREEFSLLVRNLVNSESFRLITKVALDMASAFIKLADSLREVIPFLGVLGAISVARAVPQFIRGFGSALKGAQPVKLASGGRLPGYGGGDRIPILAEAGEFIINKRSASRIGYSQLDRMNKYATGGVVGYVKGGRPSGKRYDQLVDQYIKEREQEIKQGISESDSRSLRKLANLGAEFGSGKEGFQSGSLAQLGKRGALSQTDAAAKYIANAAKIAAANQAINIVGNRTASLPIIKSPNTSLITGNSILPPYFNNTVRATHFTSERVANQLIGGGKDFDYSKQGIITSTADAFSNNEDVAKLIRTGKTGAFTRSGFGNSVVIMDIPEDEYRKHTVAQAAPGKVPNSQITGYVKDGQFIPNPNAARGQKLSSSRAYTLGPGAAIQPNFQLVQGPPDYRPSEQQLKANRRELIKYQPFGPQINPLGVGPSIRSPKFASGDVLPGLSPQGVPSTIGIGSANLNPANTSRLAELRARVAVYGGGTPGEILARRANNQAVGESIRAREEATGNLRGDRFLRNFGLQSKVRNIGQTVFGSAQYGDQLAKQFEKNLRAGIKTQEAFNKAMSDLSTQVVKNVNESRRQDRKAQYFTMQAQRAQAESFIGPGAFSDTAIGFGQLGSRSARSFRNLGRTARGAGSLFRGFQGRGAGLGIAAAVATPLLTQNLIGDSTPTRSAISGGLNGLVAGGTTGAFAGSFLGPIGTIIGGIGGALIGGINGIFEGNKTKSLEIALEGLKNSIIKTSDAFDLFDKTGRLSDIALSLENFNTSLGGVINKDLITKIDEQVAYGAGSATARSEAYGKILSGSFKGTRGKGYGSNFDRDVSDIAVGTTESEAIRKANVGQELLDISSQVALRAANSATNRIRSGKNIDDLINNTGFAKALALSSNDTDVANRIVELQRGVQNGSVSQNQADANIRNLARERENQIRRQINAENEAIKKQQEMDLAFARSRTQLILFIEQIQELSKAVERAQVVGQNYQAQIDDGLQGVGGLSLGRSRQRFAALSNPEAYSSREITSELGSFQRSFGLNPKFGSQLVQGRYVRENLANILNDPKVRAQTDDDKQADAIYKILAGSGVAQPIASSISSQVRQYVERGGNLDQLANDRQALDSIVGESFKSIVEVFQKFIPALTQAQDQFRQNLQAFYSRELDLYKERLEIDQQVNRYALDRRRLVGETISPDEARGGLLARVQALGGSTDPGQIYNSTRPLIAQQRNIQNQLASNNLTPDQRIKLEEENAKLGKAIAKNTSALEILARSTDGLQEVQEGLSRIQGQREAGTGFISQFLGLDPQGARDLKVGFAVLSELKGGRQNFNRDQLLAGEKALGTILPQLRANGSKDALDLANKLQTDFNRAALKSIGIDPNDPQYKNNPLVQNLLTSLTPQGGDPREQALLTKFDEFTKAQTDAAKALNQLNGEILAPALKNIYDSLQEQIAIMMREAKKIGFNSGGVVGGSGSGDTVPAMLTPREFVVNQRATARNLPILNYINKGGVIDMNDVVHMAAGGLVNGLDYGGRSGRANRRAARAAYKEYRRNLRANRRSSQFGGGIDPTTGLGYFDPRGSYIQMASKFPKNQFVQDRAKFAQMTLQAGVGGATFRKYYGNPNFKFNRQLGRFLPVRRFATGGLVPNQPVQPAVLGTQTPATLPPLNLGPINQLANSIGQLAGGQETFAQSVTRFENSIAQLAAIRIPERIEINAKHTVEVLINGAQILNELKPEIADIVLKQIKDTLRKYINPVTGQTYENAEIG